jgi:MFS transporter, PAT family, beta-lactamase induction signal transducer AmpG
MNKPVQGRSLRAYLEPQMLVMLALGFSSGLPFLMVGNTLGYWLREEGLSLSAIGLLSGVGLAYSLKFLWAPFVNQLRAPIFGFLGRRRGWMALSQIVVALGLFTMASTGAGGNSILLGLCALLVAFASATQDIVIDAWRIENSGTQARLGLMTSAATFGYRIAMLATDAVILIVADLIGWQASYVLYGTLMALGLAATVLASESREADAAVDEKPSLWTMENLTGRFLDRFNLMSGGNVWQLRILWLVAVGFGWWLFPNLPGIAAAIGWPVTIVLYAILITIPLWVPKGLAQAIAEPFIAFFKTYGWLALLMLSAIALYRLPDFFMGPMCNPFYHDLGIAKTVVGEVRGSIGLIASFLGIAAGGFAVLKFGNMRTLVVGGVIQALSIAAFSLLAYWGADLPLYIAVMAGDSFATSFAGVVLTAYMSSLTSLGYTATQYAMLTSAYAIIGKILKTTSGFVIDSLRVSLGLMEAYGLFFLIAGLIGIPAIFLFLLLARMQKPPLAPVSD